jgi:C-terminal processing protease CtpA/Prc
MQKTASSCKTLGGIHEQTVTFRQSAVIRPKQFMKKIFPLLLLTNFLFGQNEILRKDSVIKDLNILYYLLNEIHPGQFMHCSKAIFDYSFDSLKKSTTSDLTLTEYYCKTQFLVAKIKDGHTWVDPSTVKSSIQNRQLFPFAIYNTGDKYVISKSGNPEYDSLVGSTITKINGKNINDIIGKAVSFMSIEGKNTSAINISLQHFPFYYFLIDTTSSFRILLTDRNNLLKEINLSGVVYKSFVIRTRKIVEAIQQEFLSSNIAVLTVNTFNIGDFEYKKIDYKKYIDNFFKQVHRDNITNLIIDVRNNNGGSAEISNYLFSYLYNKQYYYFEYIGRKCKSTDKLRQYCTTPNYFANVDTTKTVFQENLYCDEKGHWWLDKQKAKKNSFSGKLIVLTNGACFSTTGHFLTLLKDNNVGQLIGECSQGSFYSNDAGLMFKLPYSGLLVRIPTGQFKMKTSHFTYDPNGICPDIEITRQKEDFISGYDRQLAEAIKLLNGQK